MICNKDSAEIKNNLIKNISELSKSFSEKFETKILQFAETTNTAEDFFLFNKKETDLSNLFSNVENNFSNQSIGALIVVSDGIYNKGSSPLFNCDKLGFPIYCVGTGDTTEVKDIAIKKINTNSVAYLGNVFPVEAIVTSNKINNASALVTLLQNGNKLSEQKINLVSAEQLSTINFTVNATKPGIQKYSVQVTIFEGEKNINNNTQSFIIDVIDNREKIAIIANAPHPDIAAIKEVLSNLGTYEIESGLANEFNKPLKQYALVIIHGGDENININLFNNCKNNNVPYWKINCVTGQSNNFKSNEIEPYGIPSFGLFTISNELKNYLKEFPALQVPFGNYPVKNGENSLLNQKIGSVETENPVLTFEEINGLKIANFIGDGLWRWKLRDFADHDNNNLFSELISKTIQYLALKSDKSFFRINAPKIINENELVDFAAELYNKSYELVNEPDVTLTLTNAQKKQFNYTFSKTSNAYKLNLGNLPADEYTYSAKVKLNNELFSKTGVLIVNPVVSEKINTVANHKLLNQIAIKTGGKFLPYTNIKDLQKLIESNETIKPITYSQTNTNPIIELKWLFALIVLIFISEWFLRKRYLTI